MPAAPSTCAGGVFRWRFRNADVHPSNLFCDFPLKSASAALIRRERQMTFRQRMAAIIETSDDSPVHFFFSRLAFLSCRSFLIAALGVEFHKV
jgi:hypothetical protein